MPAEGQSIDCSVEPSLVAQPGSEFRIEVPAQLRGRLEPAANGAFTLNGSFTASPIVSCVRCLEAFEVPIRDELELIFLPQASNVATVEDDRALDDDELAVSFYQDDEIDLAHLVWEQIVLALPMKPVCRESCTGLCPSCGVNRNVTSCTCSVQAVDPRWQSLQTLLEPERAQD